MLNKKLKDYRSCVSGSLLRYNDYNLTRVMWTQEISSFLDLDLHSKDYRSRISSSLLLYNDYNHTHVMWT